MNSSVPNFAAARPRHCSHEGANDYLELLASLEALSENSTSLLPGYAASQPGWNKREDLIPYYHVLGKSRDKDPVRILLAAGWLGTEEIATYALLRLIAGLEERFHLIDGIEATIYPILNLEARRVGVEKTDAQKREIFSLWKSSKLRPVRVLERELWRYDYDLAINLAENPNAAEFAVRLHAQTKPQEQWLEEFLGQAQQQLPAYSWKPGNGANGNFPPRLTPVPDRMAQPVEVQIWLPGQLLVEQQTDETLGLLLYLMHEVREAREKKHL